ncbi:MAG: hypothetical protein ACLQQ4_15470 [Bacteroidia bacterium]
MKRRILLSVAACVTCVQLSNAQGAGILFRFSGDDSSCVARQNIVYGGAGFFGGYNMSSPYNTYEYATTTDEIKLGYERGLSKNWGIGAIFDYSNIAFNYSGTVNNSSMEYPNPPYSSYNFLNKYILTNIRLGISFAIHDNVGERLDPYIMLIFGFNSMIVSNPSIDPNAQSDGNTPLTIISSSGIMYGGYAGFRYFFTGHIGAWFNMGYVGYGSSIINIGITGKF